MDEPRIGVSKSPPSFDHACRWNPDALGASRDGKCTVSSNKNTSNPREDPARTISFILEEFPSS